MKTTPTLVEFLLVAHFKVPIGLNVVSLADWIGKFRGEFPSWQQVVAGPAVNLQPPMEQPSLQFLAVPDVPRIVMRAPDGRQLLLQDDRIAVGWARQSPIGEPAPYHGFEYFDDWFRKLALQITDWLTQQSGVEPAARLVEIVYRNAEPLERNGSKRKLSDIIKVVNFGRPINQLAINWTELLEPSLSAPRVTANIGLGSAPPDIKIIGFDFVGLGLVDCALADFFEQPIVSDLHTKILDMFSATLTS